MATRLPEAGKVRRHDGPNEQEGSPGVDGMTVDELPEYLAENWETIREELLAGSYLGERRAEDQAMERPLWMRFGACSRRIWNRTSTEDVASEAGSSGQVPILFGAAAGAPLLARALAEPPRSRYRQPPVQ
jgi:hypothetical protein